MKEHEITTAHTHSATDAAPGLFVPDLLLASQQVMARPPDSPCRRLVASVLERALLDATGPSAKQPDRDDALAWFFTDDEEPFSFRWVALQLGIEPDWLRARIRRRQEAATRAPFAGPPSAQGELGARRAA